MKIKISEKKLSEMIINSVNKYFLNEDTQKINEIGPKMTAMALKAGSGIYPETTNSNREKNLFRSPHKIATNAYNKYFEPFIGQTFSVSTNGLGKHEIKIEKLNGAFSNLIIIDGINQNGIKIKTIIDLITFTKELEFSDGRKTKYFSFSENSSLVKRIANASKKLNQYLNAKNESIIKENEFILGEGYTHFAIDKNTNKIVNGWDYNDEDYVFWSNEDIRYYSKLDLNDQFPDRKASDFKIVSRKFLERNGVDVSDGNNWQN